MLPSQSVPYVLPSQTYVAGQRSIQTLRDLPKQLLGRLCHLNRFIFSCVLTPTYSGAPTLQGHNNLMTSVDVWDGAYMKFQGGFNHLRARERLQTGRLRLPDSDTNAASASARYFRRVLHMGPPQFAGAPSDWLVPCGMLENGEIRFQHGALADLKGTVSAATGTVRVVAYLTLMDEIRIPPSYQFVNQAANAQDINLAGRALYESIALMNSSSFDNFTVGGVANVRLDLGNGDVIPNVKAVDLTMGFHDDFAAGDISTIAGDMESATLDVGARRIDHASSTALTGVDQDLQPVLWSPPDMRISKLFLAESVARLRWDGTQTSAVVLLSRILPQPGPVIAANIVRALARLNINQKSIKIKTLSKRSYNGPLTEFMPWQVKV